MSSVAISGNVMLSGEVNIQGSKNAVLPMIAAALLNIGITVLKACPNILDVQNMVNVLRQMGCLVFWDNSDLIIDTTRIKNHEVLKEAAKKTRGSVLFLGALIGRIGIARIAYPGGCSIGKRKIDLHLKAMEEMGVFFYEEDEMLYADATSIHGSVVTLTFPSVGATENILLAAVLANGRTEIINAALEPEVTALCGFLNNAGANIKGIRTNHLIIDGVDKLHDNAYTIPPDRIVAGTYLVAVAATGGDAIIHGVVEDDLTEVLRILRLMGCEITIENQKAHIIRKNALMAPDTVVTRPFPGFPTDLQSQFMVLLSKAINDSCIVEEIFEERFLIVEELNKLGAKTTIEGNEARIGGNRKFFGTKVIAKDLRGGAALIIAGLVASEETIVLNTDYVERGYVDICKDLRQLKANISYCL
jgi:UDP-N-acetylglucosamine 1-carboxyvinyltransferase